ncbi:hypothetical protein ASG87_18095 [Frateuria sp. Soil773]|uniref:poly(R)-hydroxyalkanoic acid synthase subunit PhaE n=1 Tax=Frateuria sp. Soil773 TaxID=1736407 RepID=UPI0006FADCAC|nr:poly(R)-hydroxyalkanoic acid synthase subunit PhaE [Frateuria sp. Soil773]KRE93747.1 hypothetical protein ASG87_18095 [Frateuria sp. Soil773]
MGTQGPDFMRDYQGFAQQAWDAWTRSWQAPPPAPSFFGQPAAPRAPSVDEALGRSLSGFRSYLEWLQSAAGSGLGQEGGDWQQQLRKLFAGMQSPLAQAFAGIDSASVQGLGQQWQQWLQAAQPFGFADLRNLLQAPAFGYTREQQEQQQALQRAILDHLEASRRYQDLMLRAQVQGAERLQQKLAQRADQDASPESLKALYDLWIDAAEEAYAEIALSDEFRQVYGAQVNTQMRVRQLQKEQLEQVCRQLGMPAASEVASLGQRLQELRREVRELKRQLAAKPAAADPVARAPAPAKRQPAKAGASAAGARKAAKKPSRTTAKAAKTPARAAPRKPR